MMEITYQVRVDKRPLITLTSEQIEEGIFPVDELNAAVRLAYHAYLKYSENCAMVRDKVNGYDLQIRRRTVGMA